MARQGLLEHRKFRRLCRMLGEPPAHVLGHLQMLWRSGYENGDPYLGIDEVDVEAAAEWDGEPGLFFRSASHELSNFIEPSPIRPGWQIHDLLVNAPDMVWKRCAREIARRGGPVLGSRAEVVNYVTENPGWPLSTKLSKSVENPVEKTKEAGKGRDTARNPEKAPSANPGIRTSQSASPEEDDLLPTDSETPGQTPIPESVRNPPGHSHTQEQIKTTETPIVPTARKRDVGKPWEGDVEFLEFWSAYPRAIDKPATYRAWLKTAGVRPPLAELLASIARHKRSVQWTKLGPDGESFIPYSATWLNGQRWTADLPASQPIGPPERRRPPEKIDVAVRVGKIVSAVPATLPGFVELVASLRRISGSDAESAEGELARLDRDWSLTRLPQAMTPEDSASVESSLEATAATLSKRMLPSQIAEAMSTIRTQAIRKRFGLPSLTLFGPEASA